MSQLHGLVAQVALVLAVLAAIWSIGLAIARRPPGRLFVGNLVWIVVGVAVAALSGVAMAVWTGPPGDALHIVYGVLALGVVPGAALVAAGRPARQQSIVVAIAAIVLAILLVRLSQTGS